MATRIGSGTGTPHPHLPVTGLRLILGLLTVFGFLGALDQNVIVTTLPRMLGDTNVPIVLFTVGKAPAIEFDRAGWLVTGYLLGYVAVLPLMGAISDVYGRRRTLQAALLVFALGSTIAANAGTLPVLVLARTGQALGAGALLPVSLAATADLVGSRQQGRALGLLAAAAELGGVCGPLYGGFISQLSDLGWRLIFWLNVPIVLLLLPLTFLLPAGGTARPVDYRGSLILGVALAALVAGTSSSGIFGSSVGGGTANRLFLLCSMVLLIVFLQLERRASSPLLPVGLFRHSRLVAACAVNLLVGVALGVAIVLIPIYAATVQDVSPVDGGLLLLRYLVLLALGAAVGGRLCDRIGARRVALIGLSLATAGYWLLRPWLVVPPHSPSWLPPMLAGLGIGLVATPVTTVALRAAGRDQGGVLASMVTAARVIGMMVGLSSLTSFGSWRFHLLTQGMHMPPVPAGSGLAGLQRVMAAYGIALQGKEIAVLQEILFGAGVCCALALLPALLFTTAADRGATSPSGTPDLRRHRPPRPELMSRPGEGQGQNGILTAAGTDHPG
jgi:MFS family permease